MKVFVAVVAFIAATVSAATSQVSPNLIWFIFLYPFLVDDFNIESILVRY